MATDRKPWFLSVADDAHQKIFATVDALAQERYTLDEVWYWNAKLYDNRGALLGDTFSDYERSRSMVSENYVKSAVDTVSAVIAKNRPKATFLTDGADWSTQRQARQLDRYVEGMFKDIAFYEVGPIVFRDAALFGTGVMHPIIVGDRIKLERVWVGELFVDERAAKFTAPRDLHRRKVVDRLALKAMFGDDLSDDMDQAIDRAPSADQRYANHTSIVDTERIEIIESWHLPSRPGGDDGVHALTIPGFTLLWEEWERDFPFEFLYWTPPVCGFYGTSLVEEIAGTQLRIHKLNKFVDAVHERTVVPRIYVHQSDLSMMPRLNRTIGQLVPYKNRPPLFETARGVGGEIFQRLNDLKASIYETSGVSRLAASSRKPAELESGNALREFNDIHTERFALHAQRYEDLAPKIARHILRLSAELHRRDANPSTVWKSKKLAKRIRWRDVEKNADDYAIDIGTSSILSRTPAGRKADLQEWLTLGIIDQTEYRRMIDHPDLQRSTDLATAAIEDIEATIEEILDLGESDPLPVPEPFQDLVLGMKRMQQAYLNARRDRAPEHVLENLRTWVELAKKTMDDLAAETAAKQAAAQAAALPPPAMADAGTSPDMMAQLAQAGGTGPPPVLQ